MISFPSFPKINPHLTINFVLLVTKHFENGVINRQSLQHIYVPDKFETKWTPDSVLLVEDLKTFLAKGVTAVDHYSWHPFFKIVLFFAKHAILVVD
jgi:hypothetical protein